VVLFSPNLPGWTDIPLRRMIEEDIALPCVLDNDASVAALAEQWIGAGRGASSLVLLTLGTGIGGGGMVNNNLIHGLVHPEMGHLRIPHDWEADPFPGICPYHGDCLEGLATGPAIEARWVQKGETLARDHPAWQLEAHYLALGLVNLICTLSPHRIIIGGGVMDQDQLFPMIRVKVKNLLSDYISAPEIMEHIDQYIVPPQLGSQAGVLGAIALAQQAARAID